MDATRDIGISAHRPLVVPLTLGSLAWVLRSVSRCAGWLWLTLRIAVRLSLSGWVHILLVLLDGLRMLAARTRPHQRPANGPQRGSSDAPLAPSPGAMQAELPPNASAAHQRRRPLLASVGQLLAYRHSWPAVALLLLLLGAGAGIARTLQRPPPKFPALAGQLSPATPRPSEKQRPAASKGPLSLAEASQLAARLRQNPDAVDAVQQRLATARAADAPALHAIVLRSTLTSAGAYRSVLSRIGAALPDRRGRFPADAKAVDWLAALRRLDPTALGARSASAYRETLVTLVFAHALAATKNTEAATTLLRLAYRHGGVFRDECGRLIRAMGDYAVPSLVRAGLIDDPVAYRIVRYAGYQLDRMDRARPKRALASQQPALVAELLHAYGEARTPSAVGAVVALTKSEQPGIRAAARWATLRYLTGKKPQVRKRKLKLAGGRRSEVAQPLYLSYRQLAFHELARRYAQALQGTGKLTGDEDKAIRALKREHTPPALAELLFAAQDQQRLLKDRGALDAALVQARRVGPQKAHAMVQQALRALKGAPTADERLAKVYFEYARYEWHQRRAASSLHALAKTLAVAKLNSPLQVKAAALRYVVEASTLSGVAHRWRIAEAFRLAAELPEVLAAREKSLSLQGRTRTYGVVAASSFAASVLGLFIAAIWRRRRQAPKGKAL